MLLFVLLFVVPMNSCISNNNIQTTSKTDSETTQSMQNLLPPVEPWQEAYGMFLWEFSFFDDDSVSKLGSEEIFYKFSLRDLDNNGIPELLIFQLQKGGFNQKLTVYTYDENICKLGDYKNPTGSFISWFRIPNNSMFSGLYDCWYEGGQEYCQYLVVKDGTLVCEYLWNINRLGESPVLTELSDNKQLINDSIEAFPPYEYRENLLKTYFVNEQNINHVVMGIEE